jgi:hypothetical protein
MQSAGFGMILSLLSVVTRGAQGVGLAELGADHMVSGWAPRETTECSGRLDASPESVSWPCAVSTVSERAWPALQSTQVSIGFISAAHQRCISLAMFSGAPSRFVPYRALQPLMASPLKGASSGSQPGYLLGGPAALRPEGQAVI